MKEIAKTNSHATSLSIRQLIASVAILVLSTTYQAAASESIEYETDRAVLAGSGCINDVDAFVLKNGSDLQVVLSNLGIDLPGNATSPLSARSGCAIRIPVTGPQGFYVKFLRQKVDYGVHKTRKTKGSITTRTTYLGIPIAPLTIDFKYGSAIEDYNLSQYRDDVFDPRSYSWHGAWCSSRRASKGIMQIDLAVSGQKDNPLEDLIIYSPGFDLRYGVDVRLARCYQ
ncbi:MAG: hypothetical protein NT027_00890 [Proteobacteria bacterium]|nr:hypothetical protein [Pseudomonadota bacterium]